MALKKKYQRSNQKPLIEGQTIQWYKRKSTKEVIRSRKSRDRQYNGIKEKVPKRSSAAVNRRTDNTMVLRKKYQRGNQKP
jgi:hypothetical protein